MSPYPSIRSLLALTLLTVTSLSAESVRPNIIFVMADDMGWGQTGYNNHPLLKTPELDAMAANGLRFNRFYAGNPVCSPTRATVLTGRTNDRAGVLSHGYALRQQEKTIAQALKSIGYATGHFGKWHLNGFKGPGAPILKDDPYSPAAFGFDEMVSATNFIDMDPLLGRNGQPEAFVGDSSEVIVDEALQFIHRQVQAEKPFFAIIWYGTPHSPFKAFDRDKEPFSHLNAESADHHGELVAMDRSIGTLRQQLRQLGVADNTLLVFNSDNGGLPGIEPATTGDLRGNKGQIYEGGLRVPGIIEWPAIIKPRITDFPAGTIDLFPTVADILGLGPEHLIQPVDGISLKPLFTQDLKQRSQPMPFRYGDRIAIIDNHTKILTQDINKGEFELYDLAQDPAESTDLSKTHPELLETMKTKLLATHSSINASFAGRDYPGGQLSPPDPEPIAWYESELYKPWLAQWDSYWAYQRYLHPPTTNSKGKGKGKAKK